MFKIRLMLQGLLPLIMPVPCAILSVGALIARGTRLRFDTALTHAMLHGVWLGGQ